MPWVKSAANGSFMRLLEVAGGAHRAREEARVEQVQDGVLDAADVLVHRQPVGGGLLVDGRVGVRRREAHEVPRAVDERVHGVRLAPRGLAAGRAIDVLPRRMPVERVAGHVEGGVVRQRDGQLVVGHGHDAAVLAVDDRDRAAPVALARDAPVAQAVVDLALGDRLARELLALQALGHLLERGAGVQAVQEARVDHHAVVGVGGVADGEGGGVGALGATTGTTGRPYLRANSRSRWSPDGQPKMAPVP